jgi:hypothetical protein
MLILFYHLLYITCLLNNNVYACRECELKKGSSLNVWWKKLKSFLSNITHLRLYSGLLVRKCIT